MWNGAGATGADAASTITSHDTVIREIPVFLSNTLSQSLYLVQYPLRPRTTSSDDHTLLKAQYKSSQEKLELTFAINPDLRYDTGKGRRFKKDMKSVVRMENNDANSNSDSDSEDEAGYLQEHTLESSLTPKCSNPPIYVVAVVKNGQLHLTPVKNVLQMKPTFPHVNASDLRRRENKENQMDVDDETEEPEASKVTVKFTEKRDKTKKPSAASLHKHFNTFQKKLADEPWIPLEPVEEGEPKELILDRLISKNTGTRIDGFGALGSKTYCNLLFPKSSDKLVLDLDYKCS